MSAAIVKHRSICNILNIKVKFLCYNVKAYESRARKINMKLFWKKQQLETRHTDCTDTIQILAAVILGISLLFQPFERTI